MSKELSKWRRAMSDHAREIMTMLATIAEAEERLDRLKKIYTEEYKKVDAALDKDVH